MLIDYYTPKNAKTMMNQVFPKVVNGRIRYKMGYVEVSRLRGCCFLSRNRIKKMLRTWKPDKHGMVTVNVVEYDSAGDMTNTYHSFQLPGELEGFTTELANLADLHGIVKMDIEGGVWVRKARDPSELNIDSVVMDRILRRIDGVCGI